MLKRPMVVALTAVAASLFTSPVMGKPVLVEGQRDVSVARVFIGDLNLAQSEGRKTMTRRVGSAVNNLCEYDGPSTVTSVEGNSFVHVCKAGAWASARPQMDAAIQLAQSGRGLETAAALAVVAHK